MSPEKNPTVNTYSEKFEGDTGSGGDIGGVPAPEAGDAAAGKYLCADGTWAVPSGGGSGPFQFATVTISSAQIKSLIASPVVLLPAPGSGKVLVPLLLVLQFKPNTTPYTSDSGSSLAIASSSGDANLASNIGNASSIIGQTAVGFAFEAAVLNGVSNGDSPINAGYVLTQTGTNEFTLGDGTLVVTVFYAVVTLS